MKKRFFILLGLWIMILPFLGFPNNWRKALFIATGATLIILAISKSSKRQSEPSLHEAIE